MAVFGVMKAAAMLRLGIRILLCFTLVLIPATHAGPSFVDHGTGTLGGHAVDTHLIKPHIPPSPKNLESVCRSNQTYINCFSRSLKEVPTEIFPVTANTYNLGNNSITHLKNFAFEPYGSLTFLDLSNNNIAVLEIFCFVGLDNLQKLDLWNNALIMTAGRFPDEVFFPLSSLETLWLNRNTPSDMLNSSDVDYPHLALSKLANLKNLYMDGLTSKNFGPGFQNLTNLTILSVNGGVHGYCKIQTLSNATFQYVPNLEELDMFSCGLWGDKIDAGAFLPLKRLVSLDIEQNENIGFQFLNRIFYGLHETTTMRKLYIRNIMNSHSIGVCLDNSFINYIPQNVTHIMAGENVLEGVDRNVIGTLPPALEILDISGNAFAFGTYFMDLPKMKQLTHLVYSGKMFERSLPTYYPYGLSGGKRNVIPHSNCSLYETHESENLESERFILRLPPNLRNIQMNYAGLKNIITNLTVDPDNSLEILCMEGNHFERLVGPITGLNSLKSLHLADNGITEVSDFFFHGFTSLMTLDLSSNVLGKFFNKATETNIFSSLTNLAFLNLTYNDIESFHPDTFLGLVHITTLLLGHNPLTNFDVNILHMAHLEYLYLKDTRIAFLPVDTRNHIDFLLSQHIGVHLSLAESPIACNCDHASFLKWLTESKVVVEDKKSYLCLYPDSSSKPVSDFYNSTLETLSRQCSSNSIIFFTSGSVTLFALFVILVAVVYRCRWKLRYLYYAAYLHYSKVPRNDDSEFEFDAFISYAVEDEKFVIDKLTPELERRELKLCIHERDFTAGDYIASNIVRAVCNSRRTVVVLTRSMLNSYWCGYEIQMANMEAVHRGRRVMVFLIMEDIPDHQLGREFLYNIRNNTYIPFPDSSAGFHNMDTLWDRLAADITRT